MRRAEEWRRNLGLKILSVALAGLLWSFVHGAKIVERELVLPLRCINLADSLALATAPPAEARVLVSGATQDFVLRRLVPGAELRVDLARARPPLARITPTATEVAMGGTRLTVLRLLEPGVLDLAIDRRVARRVPVQVVVQGEPAPGHRLRGVPSADPPDVVCTGPSSRVESLRAVLTEPVSIAGRDARFDTRAPLAPSFALVVVQPAGVRVVVDIERAPAGDPDAALGSPPAAVARTPGAP